MYMNRMIEIGKADNGYVIECRVPFKAKEGKKGESVAYEPVGEKKYVAKDLEAVTALVGKLMPMLDETYTSEDEFNKAFESAAK